MPSQPRRIGRGVCFSVTTDPTIGIDDPAANAVDVTSLYIAGKQANGGGCATGGFCMRIEKRDKTTGALITSFGSQGVFLDDPTNGDDNVEQFVLDTTSLYASGDQGAGGTCTTGNKCWHNFRLGLNDSSASFSNTYSMQDTAIQATSVSGQLTISGASGTLTSNVIDTGTANGAGFISMLWRGTVTSPAKAGLQLATSNSIFGPWTFRNPTSATCSSATYAEVSPGTVISVSPGCASNWNQRYFRYLIRLCYDVACTATSGTSPTVTDVTVNWTK